MENKEIEQKLKQLKTEDFIWLIYIGIIFASWIANEYERKYFIENNLDSKRNYRIIMTTIFIVLVAVYIYFFKDSYKDLKNIKPSDSKRKKDLTFLSTIASLLILISGIIYLFVVIADENLEVELAFN